MSQPRSPVAGGRSRPQEAPTKGREHRGHIRALRQTKPILERRTALSRVLACWPHELEDESRQARQHIVDKLRRALRAERRRGLGGHWTYDLGRHIELLRLYRAELATLAEDARPCPTHGKAVRADGC